MDVVMSVAEDEASNVTIDPRQLVDAGKRTPKPLYCICRSPDDDELMIQCDSCEDWFHVNCIGITEDEASALERYDCPNCVQLPGKSGMVEAELYERLCARETCMNAVGKDGVYCSTECASMAGEDEHAIAKRKKNATSASLVAPKKRKRPASPPMRQGGTMKSASQPKASNPINPKVKDVAFQPVMDPLRGVILDKLTRLLQDIHPLIASRMSEDDAPLLISVDALPHLAKDIEAELFLLYSQADAKTARHVPTNAYKTRFRALDHHLRDVGNLELRSKVLTGKIRAEELVAMKDEELVSGEARERMKQAKEQALKEIIKQDEKTGYVRKTHKGEEFVGEQSALTVATEMKETVPETPSRKMSTVSSQGEPETPREDPLDKFFQSYIEPKSTLTSPVEDKPPALHLPVDINAILEKQAAVSVVTPVRTDEIAVESSEIARKSASPVERSFTPPLPDVSAPIWTGKFMFQEVGRFPSEATQIGGRRITSRGEWSDILPSTLTLGGRIDPARATDYLSQIKQSSTKELLVLLFQPPASLADRKTYQGYWEYFLSKDRWGVVSFKYVTVKDMYIVPVATGDGVPECIQHVMPEDWRADQDVLLAIIIHVTADIKSSAQSKPTTSSSRRSKPVTGPNARPVSQQPVKSVLATKPVVIPPIIAQPATFVPQAVQPSYPVQAPISIDPATAALLASLYPSGQLSGQAISSSMPLPVPKSRVLNFDGPAPSVHGSGSGGGYQGGGMHQPYGNGGNTGINNSSNGGGYQRHWQS